MMVDRHSLTREWCCKKPEGWDYIPYVGGGLSADEREHIKNLPVIIVTYPQTKPMDEFVPQDGVCEWLVRREIPGHEPETYYCNTEGYEYMRYAFKLHL